MAIAYYTDIDLKKNQLQNARIHACAGSTNYPSNPVEGQVVYDTSTHLLMVYKGSTLQWKAVGEPLSAGDYIRIDGNEINLKIDGTISEGDILTVDGSGNVVASTLDINGHTLGGASIVIEAGDIPFTNDGSGDSSSDTVYDVVDELSTTGAAHIGDTNNPHGVTASQLGDGTLSANVKATTPDQSSNDTSIATTAYVTQKFGTIDALTYKGAIAGGSTGDYGALTAAASKGDVYKVSAAGKIDGVPVEAGDMIICNADSTAAATSSNYETIASSWDFIQGNIDGVVTSSATSTLVGQIAIFSDTSGRVIGAGIPSTYIQTTPTAVTHTQSTAAGSATQPVYVDADGVATAITHTIEASVPSTASFSTYVKSDSVTKSGSGNVLTGFAATGNAITFTTGSVATTESSVTHPTDGTYAGTGSATKGVYVDSDGVVQPMTYSVQKDVPSDALFTDHITTATPSGTGNVVTDVTADASGALTVTKGTVQDTATAVTHTASTAAGDQYTPVYVAANGAATALGYTIKKSVPADALFTDHITTATDSGTGNVVTGVSADANGALTVTKGSIPVVRTVSGTIAANATTATVNYSGTYLSSYVKDSSNNIVMTSTVVSNASATFTCSQAPGVVLTCVVVYIEGANPQSI